MRVRFPMYCEVVGYQEWDIPDDELEDTDDETLLMDSVYDWLDANWWLIPLPDETEFIGGSCDFDWDSTVEIIDNAEDIQVNENG